MDGHVELQRALQELVERSAQGTAAWQQPVTLAEGWPAVSGIRERTLGGTSTLLLWEAAPLSRMFWWRPALPGEDVAPVQAWLPGARGPVRWVAGPPDELVPAVQPEVPAQVHAVLAEEGEALAQRFSPYAAPLHALSRALTCARLRLGVSSPAIPGLDVDLLHACASLAQVAADRALWRLAPPRQQLRVQELLVARWGAPPEGEDWLERLEQVLDRLAEAFARDGVLRGPQAWALAEGRRLARALHHSEDPGLGDTALQSWALLRRRHLRAAWPHLWGQLRYRELIQDPAWQGDRLARLLLRARRDTVYAQTPLAELPCALVPIDVALAALGRRPVLVREEDWRGRMLRALQPQARRRMDWEGLLAALAPFWRYTRHPIPKRDGGLRWLDVPSPELAAVQRICAKLLVAATPHNGAMAGFLPRRGPAVHALAHQGARAIVSVDIEDFFGSVRPAQLRRCLARSFAPPFGGGLSAWSEAGREALLRILFLQPEDRPPHLPQGSPASPAAANLAALALDAAVRKAATARWGRGGFVYTRYADDLVLSTRSVEDLETIGHDARALLEHAVQVSGWRINPRKTLCWQQGQGPAPYLCGIRPPERAGETASLGREATRKGRAARRPSVGTSLEEQVGTRAWLYVGTGHPGWLAYNASLVHTLGQDVVGEVLLESFLVGWDSSLDGP